MRRKDPPPGMVTERVLRGLIRAVLRKVKDPNLTPKETMTLLKEQRKLAKQLKASVAAQAAMDLDDRRERERARTLEVTNELRNERKETNELTNELTEAEACPHDGQNACPSDELQDGR